MRAEIIAVGSEILLGQVVNTNATYLSEELNKLGINVFYHSTVGDNPDRMKEVFDIACKRADIVISTGGLGPTADDITNETWCEFFNLEMNEDPEQRKIIEKKFKGREIPEINFKQAKRPKDSKVIPNAIGTAIGLILEQEIDKKPVTVMTFPGVPIEMKEMFGSHIVAYLKSKMSVEGTAGVIVSRDIRFVGITESAMAQAVKELFDTENPSLAPYASIGECRLRITAKADTEHKARNLIQPLQIEIEKRLGDHIYGYDEDTLPTVVSDKLRKDNLVISFAESCTGGLLSKMMTDIPGSSDYTKINFVTYSNEAKSEFLSIDLDAVNKHGAVSAETAKAMAEGLSEKSKSDVNVSITGIAGPDGGSPEKPVGTVYVGITHKLAKNLSDITGTNNGFVSEDEYKNGYKTFVTLLDLSARENLTRAQIRELTAKRTLNLVRKLLY